LKPAPLKGWGPNGGTYPNLFDAHPPFQIDGNFGCTSGIAEMLLQSLDGAIHFLPALPDAWKTGSISGLKAYGGFEISFNWENGEVKNIVIKSSLGGNCRIRSSNELNFSDGKILNQAKDANSNPFFTNALVKSPLITDPSKIVPLAIKPTFTYDFPTQAGGQYTIAPLDKK
jgi:alpha-L-fucosidase 2